MEATEGQHPEAQGLLGILERIEAAGAGEKEERARARVMVRFVDR